MGIKNCLKGLPPVQRFSTLMLVVAVALLDDEGRALLQKRRPDRVHGGLWEFPGGKIEPGEPPETAAIREIEEELGLAVAADDLVPLTFASGETVAGAPLVILLYTCRDWRGRPTCHDAEELAWFRPGEFLSLAMPPLDYPLARALIAKLRQSEG